MCPWVWLVLMWEVLPQAEGSNNVQKLILDVLSGSSCSEQIGSSSGELAGSSDSELAESSSGELAGSSSGELADVVVMN